MSASLLLPWDILGVAPGATEKEIRRAYATKLKQIDTATDSEGFEVLRWAYEEALSHLRPAAVASAAPPQEVDKAGHWAGQSRSIQSMESDSTNAFRTMRKLVADRDYSVDRWKLLLNSPSLDSPEASARFEYELVDALSENELKTEYTLSADLEWLNLVESRYAWLSDGLRYVEKFPRHIDLRDALVDLRKPRKTYTAHSSHGNPTRWVLHPGLIALVAIAVLKIILGQTSG